ncbi:MAG: NifU family protein [Bacteroidia bacterium]
MIYTEITPNPASLKFVVDRVVVPVGSADFPTVDATDDAPLARKLFDFRFVDEVFFGKNFITITKGSEFQWEQVIPMVKDFLKNYFAANQPIVTGELAKEAPASESTNDSDVVTRIKQELEQKVRPAVASDGGDIIFESFEDGVVKLRLQGACSGCPSSTVTLKQGIEGLLTRFVPEVKSVEAV